MIRRSLLALALLLTAACSGGDDDAGPSSTRVATTSTSVVDRSGVVLPAVGGETTTTIDEVGTARLVGTVRGPNGLLAGATVRTDRIVGGREVRRDVVTGPDGRWELRDVPGGRYRVRAYLAPGFAQTTAEVRFLADGEEHPFDLVVDDQGALVVRADAAPDPPQVGAPVNLVVLVAQRTVDPDGVVRTAPVSGATVELSGLGRWVLRSAATGGSAAGSTSATLRLTSGGSARVELRCLAVGAPGLTLRVARPVAVETVPLDLPACVTAPTTTSATPTAGGGSSTTSSTSPSATTP